VVELFSWQKEGGKNVSISKPGQKVIISIRCGAYAIFIGRDPRLLPVEELLASMIAMILSGSTDNPSPRSPSEHSINEEMAVAIPIKFTTLGEEEVLAEQR